MEKTKLAKIKKAVRNVKSENDTFMIEGENFSCHWNGHSFIWIVDGRKYENCTIKEVISFIGDGQHITNYCYDYDNQ